MIQKPQFRYHASPFPLSVTMVRIGLYLWVTFDYEDFCGGTWGDSFIVLYKRFAEALDAASLGEDIQFEIEASVGVSFMNMSVDGLPIANYTDRRLCTLRLGRDLLFLKDLLAQHRADIVEKVNSATEARHTVKLSDHPPCYQPPSFIAELALDAVGLEDSQVRVHLRVDGEKEHRSSAPLELAWLIPSLIRARMRVCCREEERIHLPMSDNTTFPLDSAAIIILHEMMLGA